MFRGMYTVTSAMQTSQKKLDVVSNNLANADTRSYKKDVVVSEAFPEKLISKINGRNTPEVSTKSLEVELKREGDGFKASTNNGYFVVASAMGDSYNKEMRFTVDEEGYLKTYTRDLEQGLDASAGFYVLDSNGQKIQVQSEDLSVDNKGNLLDSGNIVANLINKPSPRVIGTINGGLRFDRIMTNFSGGSLEETNRTLDFAIKGNGFFRVYTEDGYRYTRDGSFKLNDEGQLVTKDGDLVLGQKIDSFSGEQWRIADVNTTNIDDQNLQPIVLANEDNNASGDFKLKENGEIYIGDELRGKLDVVNFENTNTLRKQGDNLYFVEGEPEFKEFDGKVITGFLEGSNVTRIREVIEMTTLLRSFDTNQRVVKAYDEMMNKAVNNIGKV